MASKNLLPLEFILTPQERTAAAYATVLLDERRRQANERDAIMAARNEENGEGDEQRNHAVPRGDSIV